jgi:hypothetical protein
MINQPFLKRCQITHSRYPIISQCYKATYTITYVYTDNLKSILRNDGSEAVLVEFIPFNVNEIITHTKKGGLRTLQ